MQKQQRQYSRQDRKRQTREPPHTTSPFIILFLHLMPVPVMRIRVMRVPVDQPGVAMAV